MRDKTALRANIKKLYPAHARYVLTHLREWDKKEAIAGHGPKFLRQCFADVMSCEHGWSYHLNGKPVAIIGGHGFENVYIAYMLATVDFPKISPGLSRFVISTMLPLIAESAVSRAECLSLPGHVEAHGWLRRLGAEPVDFHAGIGRQGEDFLRWRWTPKRDVHFLRRRERSIRQSSATGG